MLVALLLLYNAGLVFCGNLPHFFRGGANLAGRQSHWNECHHSRVVYTVRHCYLMTQGKQCGPAVGRNAIDQAQLWPFVLDVETPQVQWAVVTNRQQVTLHTSQRHGHVRKRHRIDPMESTLRFYMFSIRQCRSENIVFMSSRCPLVRSSVP